MGSHPNMTGVFIKRGNMGTDMHTGRAPCEDGGTDQGHASMSQRLPKVSRTLRSQERSMEQTLLHSLRRNQPHQHLDLELLVSRL